MLPSEFAAINIGSQNLVNLLKESASIAELYIKKIAIC